jgi:hypothetical protein
VIEVEGQNPVTAASCGMLGCATALVGCSGIRWSFSKGLDLRGGWQRPVHGKDPGGQSSGCAHTVRFHCSRGDANLLRTGEAQSLVHIGLCRVVRDGIGLRIPSGRLAIRAGGIGLVRGSGKTLVDRKVIQSLLILRAYSSSLSGLA